MTSVLKTIVLAAATLAALGAASSAFAGGRPDLVARGLAEGRAHVADQLIVQFRTGATESDKQRVMGRVNGNRAEVLARGHRRIDAGGDIELLNLRGRALRDAIADLQGDSAVEFAEPNWILQHTAVSNDTYYTNGSLWGMYGNATSPANQFGSQAGEAWASGADCSNVVVGIIDEGYMHTHADLAANAFKKGQYALANLLYHPTAKLFFGPELQWGDRENFRDGFSSDDVRVQFSARYDFAASIGGGN